MRSLTRVVKKRLADGSIKEYRYDRGSAKRAGPDKSSIGALLTAYQGSPEYRALRPATHSNYKLAIQLWRMAPDNAVRSISRSEILTMRNRVAAERGDASANQFISATSAILSWARSYGWIDASPCVQIEALEGGELPAWSEEQAAVALKRLPEHLRRVVVLGLNTGQRRLDLCLLKWSALEGDILRVVPVKTETKNKVSSTLFIPVTPSFKRELAKWKKQKTGDTILETMTGKPWIPEHLSREMTKGLQAIGLPSRINIHGLRKLAAVRLANAGCSAHEIAAITGHKSLAMVQHYTLSADQQRMAQAAMARLHPPRETRRKPERDD